MILELVLLWVFFPSPDLKVSLGIRKGRPARPGRARCWPLGPPLPGRWKTSTPKRFEVEEWEAPSPSRSRDRSPSTPPPPTERPSVSRLRVHSKLEHCTRPIYTHTTTGRYNPVLAAAEFWGRLIVSPLAKQLFPKSFLMILTDEFMSPCYCAKND